MVGIGLRGWIMVKDNIKNIIRENFGEVYLATRVWSAWSYGTMSVDDFVPLSEDEYIIDELTDKLIKSKNKDEIYGAFQEYELYYNNDIENDFNPDSFDDDWLYDRDIVDMESISERIMSVIKKNKINKRIKLR